MACVHCRMVQPHVLRICQGGFPLPSLRFSPSVVSYSYGRSSLTAETFLWPHCYLFAVLNLGLLFKHGRPSLASRQLLRCCWHDRRRLRSRSTLRRASPSTTTSPLTDVTSSASTFSSTTSTNSRFTRTASPRPASPNRRRSELVRTPPSYTSHSVSFCWFYEYPTGRKLSRWHLFPCLIL